MDAKPSFIAQAPSPQPRYLQPAGLYDSLPNGYTHVVTVQEPLRWLFVSGQGGENASCRSLIGAHSSPNYCHQSQI